MDSLGRIRHMVDFAQGHRHMRIAAGLALICLTLLIVTPSHDAPSYASAWTSARVGTSQPAKCAIVQHTGFNVGGYGDHLRHVHRAELAAQVLDCEVLRTYTRTHHNYTTSDLFSGANIRINLSSARTCSLGNVLDVTGLEANNHDCSPKVIGDPSNCDIYSYNPPLINNSNKLKCVADRLRSKFMPLPPPSSARQACSNGYTALHHRQGDLAGRIGDFRLTTASELQLAIEHVRRLHPHWPRECIVVFAEGYPHTQIEGVEAAHVVDTNPDVTQVMSDLAHAEIIFAGPSGFMGPVALIFRGSEMLVVKDLTQRYEGVVLGHVKITEIDAGVQRSWPDGAPK